MRSSNKYWFICVLCLLFAHSANVLFAESGVHPSSCESVEPLKRQNLKTIQFGKNNNLVFSSAIAPRTEDGRTEDIAGLSSYRFEELDDQLESLLSAGMTTSSMPPNSDNLAAAILAKSPGNLSAKAKRAKEIICKAKQVGNVVDQLTGGDLVKMPLIKTQQIGNIDVEFIFNEAKIHPTYAEISVYVRMVVPQKEIENSNAGAQCQDDNGQEIDEDAGKTVLYFGAERIFFSQEKGIIKGSLGLLSDYAIQLGDDENPKSAIWLNKMEKGKQIAGQDTDSELDDEFEYSGCYINFDCDGFKEMGVGGRIFFSREWIIPTDDFGTPVTQVSDKDIGGTPRVRADIQLIAQDWNDLLVSVNLSSPFTLVEWNQMAFAIGNANLDLSSYRNPPNVPDNYAGILTDGEAWEGVYIETLSIALPKPFKRTTGSFSGSESTTERIKISAKDMFVDQYGVSGIFSVSGQSPLIGGGVVDGEWGWSLDQVGIRLEFNQLIEFNFSGQLGVPILAKDSPILYSGDIRNIGSPDEYYHFTAGLDEDKPLKIPVWNAAQISLDGLALEAEVVDDEFEMTVSFAETSLTVGNPADVASDPQGSSVELPKVTITNLSLSTNPDQRFSYGEVHLENIGGGSKLMNFPITPTLNNLSTNPDNPDQLIMDFSLILNLTSQDDNGISAEGSLSLIGKYEKDVNGAHHWEFERLKFNGVDVTLDLPQVYGKGRLCMFEEHETYGKGFSASMSVEIIGNDLHQDGNQGKFKVDMMAIFGSNEGYRYFLVDGFAGGDIIHVPIYPTIFLNGFGGGVFHNMRPSGFVGDQPAQDCPEAVSTSGIKYVPTTQTKFGIQFATTFVMEGGVMDGRLTCIIRFSQSMSLQNITFWGVADIMPSSEFATNITGSLDKLNEQLDEVPKNTDEIKEEAAREAKEVTSGIKAKVGISFDFEDSFAFHGYAEATIKFTRSGEEEDDEEQVLLAGKGALDILIDFDEDDPRFHIYLGGYYTDDPDRQVRVPDFFGNGEIVLSPVSVAIDYDGFSVSANLYCLTGNDIPGPPPIPPHVIDFFELDGDENNRGMLSCGDMGNSRSKAKGTGIAFGAHAYFSFKKKKKGLFGSCFLGYDVKVEGGFGFDISLLKYPKSAVCPSSDKQPMGLNGFRAGGLAYVFIDLDGNHVTCLPLPPLGIGLMVRFDVPNPAYFQVVAIVKVGRSFRFNLELGEECGTPCMSEVQMP